MRVKRFNDKRSFYRRFMDFVFGEKLTEEELEAKKQLEMVAHAHMLGAGGGATGVVEVISMKKEKEKTDEE